MRTIEIVVTVCSCLSVLGSLLLVVSYTVLHELRRHPTQLVAYISFCDLIFNAKFLFSVIVPSHWIDVIPSSTSCFVSSMTGQFFGVASIMWNCIMALNMILVLRNPFAYTANYYLFYHLNAWGWSLVTSIILVIFHEWGPSNFGHICWIKGDGTQNDFELLYIVPLAIAGLVSIVSVGFYLHRLLHMSHNEHYNRHRQRRLRRMIGYVSLFVIFRSIFIIQYIVQDSGNVDDTLLYMNVIGTTAHAFVNSILWFTQQTFLVWYKKLYASKVDQSIIEPLIREEGIRSSTVLTDDVMLRKDIMGLFYTGIIHTVEETTKLVRNRDIQEMDSSLYSNMRHNNSNNNNDVSSSSGSRTTTRFSLIRPSDYNVVTEHILYNSTGKKGGLIFSDHAAVVFHNLRKLAHISPNAYKESIRQELLTHNATSYGKFSDGKSGSFFCVTSDKRFVVKTVSRTESELLTEILPHYYNYITANPDSLIVRFVGSYAFRIYEGPNINFVVMKNILYIDFPLHLRFDLKGSWVNRAAGGEYTSNPRRTVGKDLDLADQFVEVEEEDRERLLNILRRDSQFLAQMQLMDYSLLLGIHLKNMPTQIPLEIKPGSFSRHDLPLPDALSARDSLSFGTLNGVDTRCVMGIIDILQRFTLRKRIERFVKTKIFREDKYGISVLKPEYYADRFFDKMETVFISHSDFAVAKEDDRHPASVTSSGASENDAIFIFSENYKNKVQLSRSYSGSNLNFDSPTNSFKTKRDRNKRISFMKHSV